MESDILKAIREGREVQTRSGLPVRIYATDGYGRYGIHGAYCNSSGDWFCGSWDQCGKSKSENNLMTLVVKKKTVEVDFWVNVYPNGGCHTHPSDTTAKEAACNNRIACINIKRTVTEGEGL